MSLDHILADFDLSMPSKREGVKDGKPVSIWVPLDQHARYERLQQLSGKRFGKKMRELLLAAMDMAERRAG